MICTEIHLASGDIWQTMKCGQKYHDIFCSNTIHVRVVFSMLQTEPNETSRIEIVWYLRTNFFTPPHFHLCFPLLKVPSCRHFSNLQNHSATLLFRFSDLQTTYNVLNVSLVFAQFKTKHKAKTLHFQVRHFLLTVKTHMH